MSDFFKIFKLLFLALVFFILQISFINSLTGVFFSLNFVLFYLIYVFIFYDLKTSLIVGFFTGFLLDLFSFNFFGAYSLSILITIFIANFLLLNLFTNKSIYSFLAIGFFYCFFYYLTFNLFVGFDFSTYGFGLFNSIFLLNFLKELFFVSLAISFSFYFLNIEDKNIRKKSW